MNKHYPSKDFVWENRHPKNIVRREFAHSVVNALAIALDISWQDACKQLVEQAKLLHILPEEAECVNALLRANGFYPQPLKWAAGNAASLCTSLQLVKDEGEVYICKIGHGVKYAGALTIRSRNGEKGRRVYGNRDLSFCSIDRLWVRWPDGEYHGDPKHLRKPQKWKTKTASGNTTPPDSKYFHYYQANPTRSTGDCVIRSIASVLNVDWETAMELLAGSSGYLETSLNTQPVFGRFLETVGFTCHKAIKKDGRYLTAGEFCELMGYRHFRKESIFAYSPRSHAVAVLPFHEGDQPQYKLVDSWDSSKRSIATYWVSKPEKLPPPECPESVKVGASVVHPTFGNGTVTQVSMCASTWIATVDFDGLTKDISAVWLDEHNACSESTTQQIRGETVGGAA